MQLYKQLVKEYGDESVATKAMEWWMDHSLSFRKSVKALQYIKLNEYLWL